MDVNYLLSAIENTDICTFWYYPQRQFITMDERTANIYHCRREYTDMPKSFADDFVHPSTQAAFYKMYRQIDAGEKTASASFSSIDRRNWCTVTLTTIAYDIQGRPEKSYGIIQNISEMKLREAEYHSSKRMLANIIDALSKIYMFNYYIDLETMIFIEITGLDYITDVMGTTGDVIYAFRQFTKNLIDENYKESFKDFSNMTTLAERIGTQQNISLEYLSTKQGWCRASFIVVNRNKAGVPVQVEFVVENISEERKKELEAKDQLKKAYEAANKANVSKSAFLNNMSHDIRTPMNAIIGFSSIAQTHIDDKNRVLDCISKITASSRHLLSMINEVLDMSRIESGKIYIQKQETNLPSIIHDFISMIQDQIKFKGLELRIDTINLSHENVYTDEARLHRILLNLVGNAIKFTPAGGLISVQLTEKPHTASDHALYVISVQDTGIGMSKEFLPHIFEPFERERTSTVSKVEGTGLGMPITKNIVEMMGGTISVDSEQGKGSLFTIELPLKFTEKGPEDPQIKQLAGCHAMITADDYNVCSSVSKILKKIGMEPECTMSGKEALLHIKSALEAGEVFSVYIVDWKLPDMNSLDVVRQIRNFAGDEVLIYILTSYDSIGIEEESKKAGATLCCQKPLFFSQLRSALLKSLDKESEQEKNVLPLLNKSLSGKRILLTEDNELNQEIAVTVLTEAGFIVETADDGKSAVDKISRAKEGDYDIILMDIQMPVMDGYEATKTIRAMSKEWIQKLPILAITANVFEEDRKKAIAAGMNGYLAKPIDRDKLFLTLSEILQ